VTVRARLHTIDATPEQYEAGWLVVKNDLLPWASESTGFCGAIGLVDRENGKALLLTLWTDDETRAESAAAADRLSGLAAAASGAKRESTENFDVVLVDLLGSPRVLDD
jgi:hypothetical protein